MRTARQRIGAFTLIELLIVVSIISILAAIAVPNFLEAQTRAKVARVKADMRSVATALEAYAVDNNNKYPYRKPSRPNTEKFQTFGDATVRARDLSVITTPIQYISRVPQDIFEMRIAPPNNIFDYWSVTIIKSLNHDFDETPPWVLVSVGPDGEMGGYPGWINMNLQAMNIPDTLKSWQWDYDPANGTISGGNIYRGPNNEGINDLIH